MNLTIDKTWFHPATILTTLIRWTLKWMILFYVAQPTLDLVKIYSSEQYLAVSTVAVCAALWYVIFNMFNFEISRTTTTTYNTGRTVKEGYVLKFW